MPNFRNRPPGFEYDTGGLGTAAGLLGVLYALLYVAYVALKVAIPLAGAIPLSSFLGVFLAWGLMRPVLLLVLLMAAIIEITSVVGALAVCLMVMPFLLNSLGTLIYLLLMDWMRCNSSIFPLGLCTDPLYCCVHYATRTECAGLGPCVPAPGVPQTAAELSWNPDFLPLFLFIVGFLVLELLFVILTWMLRTANVRAAHRLRRRAQNLGIVEDTSYQTNITVDDGDTFTDLVGASINKNAAVSRGARGTHLGTLPPPPVPSYSTHMAHAAHILEPLRTDFSLAAAWAALKDGLDAIVEDPLYLFSNHNTAPRTVSKQPTPPLKTSPNHPSYQLQPKPLSHHRHHH